MRRLSPAKLRGAQLFSATLLASTMLTGVGVAAAQDTGTATLDEVVVTAQKVSQSLQDVPFSIQAMGTEKLEQLQVADFNDFAKFLPSVSYQTVGPGFTSIYMRGVASGGDGNHSGSMPSVGMYLDEQPVTTIQGPLDIHVYDIERVESLAGPQGTLYGASSQAGTIRIITNKPSMAGFDAGWDAGVNTVAHGGIGYVAEGFVNQPLADNVAVRLVGWYEHDAGYIDNVPGTRTYHEGENVDGDDIPDHTINNDALVKDDFNDADTYGARAALRIDLNDDWTITPQLMAQDQKTNGVFGFDPDVGDLKVDRYKPDSSHDRWVQAAMTIEGRISDFDVTYAGSYLKRNVDSESDYSDYSFFYDNLYNYGQYWVDDTSTPLADPSQYIQAKDRYTKQTHEIRLASAQDKRFRFIVGAFYQRQYHNIQQDYRIDGLADFESVTGWPDTLWLTKQERVDIDTAAFGEATFDITDKLSVTGGVRLFKVDNSLKGFFGFSSWYSGSTGEAACISPTPVVPGGPCESFDKNVKEDGNTHKLNVTWKFDEDRMVYATWSTGYRPGGLNRRGTLPPYLSDFLTNYELGWKTTWGGNLRFNGAVFMEQWEDFQFSILGPNGLTEIRNAAQAEMKGVETEINWRVNEGLTISGSAAYTDAQLSENYCGFTDPDGNPVTDCPSPLAPKGQALPVTPKFKANLTARYEWSWADFDAHLQGSLVTQSGAWTDLRTTERGIVGRIPGYTSADVVFGVEKDGWSGELSILNAFDERGEVTRTVACAEAVCGTRAYTVPIQPRTIGVRIGKRY
ncbi:TonB-dependent receptor [Caulobacter sp. 17J80-11]|nr:TonB-dependent receptor [Caulobacter sp. 17J80-11]